VISDIDDKIDQDDAPGEKDEGFVHIGKGYIAVSRGVGLHPSDHEACQVDEKTDEDDPKGSPPHPLSFCYHKEEVTDKGDDIN
jgi:hypothetical protein